MEQRQNISQLNYKLCSLDSDLHAETVNLNIRFV